MMMMMMMMQENVSLIKEINELRREIKGMKMAQRAKDLAGATVRPKGKAEPVDMQEAVQADFMITCMSNARACVHVHVSCVCARVTCTWYTCYMCIAITWPSRGHRVAIAWPSRGRESEKRERRDRVMVM